MATGISSFKATILPEFGPRDVFGRGRARTFFSSGTFVVPTGINLIRVTVHGGGSNGEIGGFSSGGDGGAGGGCAIKTISTTPGTSYTVTVGGAEGSSSFGTECSATGGSGRTNVGTGTGGDINLSGGAGAVGSGEGYGGGGGAGYGGGAGSLYNGGGIGGNATAAGPGLSTPAGNFLGSKTNYTLNFSPLHLLDLYHLTGGVPGGPGCGSNSHTIPGGVLGGGGGATDFSVDGGIGGLGAGGGGGGEDGGGPRGNGGSGGPGFVIVEW